MDFARLVAFGLSLCLLSTTTAEDWPCWRGPRGDGVSSATELPVQWSNTDNVAWKVPIPGEGHSSPIVTGDRIFLTACIIEKLERVLLCLDRKSGRTLWQKVVVTAPLEEKHTLNSYASSTPATDGKLVWVTFFAKPRMWVVCYNLEGNEVWRQSPGEFHSKHGFCSSPVLYKDTVIINGDQDAEAFLVAFDKNSGKECWRTDRPNRTRSYCPPLLIEVASRKQLVLSGSLCVASYDPDTGKQIWIVDGPTEQFVASLVYHDGILFVTGGYPDKHVLGIRPDGQGNVTQTHIAWRDRRGVSYVPSPIGYGRWFFLVSDDGVASCYEARTGKRLWNQRLGRHHSASPIAANGLLYFTDDEGTTYVLRAAERFELVSKNALHEDCYSSPAVAGEQIFLRTGKNLYCIGKVN